MICKRCKLDKPSVDFYVATPTTLKLECKMCKREYARNYYKTSSKYRALTRLRANDRQKKLQLANTKWLIKYFLKYPCIDCGETNPVVLEFDHVRGNKKDCVSSLLTRYLFSHTKVRTEIAKCEIRCRNCHMIKTSERSKRFLFEYIKENGLPIQQ